MSISKEEVKHIAKLSRIELSEGELTKFQGELNRILGYIEVLKTIDTKGVEPLAQVTGLENAYREDVTMDSGLQDKIIKNAPEREGRFIKVKKVLWVKFQMSNQIQRPNYKKNFEFWISGIDLKFELWYLNLWI